jgi:hypothetical protein
MKYASVSICFTLYNSRTNLSPYTMRSLPFRGEVKEAAMPFEALYSCTTSARREMDEEEVLLRGLLPRSLLITNRCLCCS